MLHFHRLVLSLLTAMLTDCFRFVPLMGVPNCPSPPLLQLPLPLLRAGLALLRAGLALLRLALLRRLAKHDCSTACPNSACPAVPRTS